LINKGIENTIFTRTILDERGLGEKVRLEGRVKIAEKINLFMNFKVG